MSRLWITQSVPNVMWVKKAVELRLKDHWITTWCTNTETKSLCSNYRIIKINYGMEDYTVNPHYTNALFTNILYNEQKNLVSKFDIRTKNLI